MYKYKYNGKEYQDELGLNMYDYGARFYNPGIGNFWQLDPVSETSRSFSPYTYALNSPVYFIDRDGMYADVKNIQEVAENCCPGFPPNQAPKKTSPLGSTLGNFTPSSKTTSLFDKGIESLSNVFTYELGISLGYTVGIEAKVGPVKAEADATLVSATIKTTESNILEAKVEGLGGGISASYSDAKIGLSGSTGSSELTVDKKGNIKTTSSGPKISPTLTKGKDVKLTGSNSGSIGLSVKIPSLEGVSAKLGFNVNLYNAGIGIGNLMLGGISYLGDRAANLFDWE